MKFNYARDALKYLIKEFSIEEIYIPYYLCDVIRHSIVEIGSKPLFYHIDDEFMPAREFPTEAFILYPNYFGICDNNVEKMAEKYPKLIVDNAHAYYAKPKGFASFDSERKFLNTEFGANLYIGCETNNIKPDYNRRNKFLAIHEKLKSKNCLNIKLNEDSIPFCYPYLAETIDEADRFVNSHKELTIYRYWNALPASYNEYKFYSRLVPISL